MCVRVDDQYLENTELEGGQMHATIDTLVGLLSDLRAGPPPPADTGGPWLLESDAESLNWMPIK